MRRLWGLILVLVLPTLAVAKPSSPDHAEVDGVSELAVVERDAPSFLDAPLTLEFPTPDFETLEPQSLQLSMDDPGPETLSLSIDVHPVLSLYVSADLSSELPRLDAMDGDTYFSVGAELHLTPSLSLFVEDFQPASGVIGADDQAEPAPLRSWDGHQIDVGVRWQVFGPDSRVTFTAAVRVYTLSDSRRDTDVGCYAGLAFRF